MDIQGIDDESNRGIIWFAQKGSSQSQRPKETLPCSEPAKPVEASEATTAKAPRNERNRCFLMPKKKNQKLGSKRARMYTNVPLMLAMWLPPIRGVGGCLALGPQAGPQLEALQSGYLPSSKAPQRSGRTEGGRREGWAERIRAFHGNRCIFVGRNSGHQWTAPRRQPASQTTQDMSILSP